MRVSELRSFAPDFLGEAADKVGGALADSLKRAQATYVSLPEAWSDLARLFPFHGASNEEREAYTKDAERAAEAVPIVATIVEEEGRGVGQLRDLLTEIS